jgi:hypothetical protein
MYLLVSQVSDLETVCDYHVGTRCEHLFKGIWFVFLLFFCGKHPCGLIGSQEKLQSSLQQTLTQTLTPTSTPT